VKGRPRRILARAVAGLAFAAAAAPGAAQDEPAIAALIAESDSPANAMATARQQSDSGDLTGAASTLERALLADPNAHHARLLYAATLCRLGDPQGARIEIAKLDRQDIDPAGWREANEACGGTLRRPLPAEASQGAGLSGEAYAGIAYDHDSAGAITLPIDFFSTSGRDDGISAIGGVRLNWRSTGFGSGGGIYLGGALQSKHDISGPDLDYDIGELRGGYGRGNGATAWSVGPVLRHVRLFDDPYVTEYGGQVDLLFGNASANKLRLRAELVEQDYRGSFPGDAGDGVRGDLSLAYEGHLRERGYWSVGIGGEIKRADEKSLGYAGGRLFAALFLPFETRHYLTLAGTLRHIDFRDNSTGFDRKDWRGFARFAYGIPLVGGLFAEGAVSYTYRKVDTDSMIDIRRYRSPGAELRLIWKF
jgi:hypothetical protein